MKKFAAIGPLGLLIISGASAQTNPFTVRGGYAYAFDKGANGSGAASGYTFGVGWDFMELKGSHTRLGLDLDFSNNDLRGNKVETSSLQLVGRMPVTMGKGPRFYVGAGVGAYRSFVGGTTTTSSFTGSSTVITSSIVSNTQTEIGGELLLGCRFDEHWGLEAYYRVTEVNSGVEPNTVGLVAAFHF